MRSPSKAPPVRFLVGSVQRKATFKSGSSRMILSINSSSNEDFPAPPVPVMPTTGAFWLASWERHFISIFSKSGLPPFSAKVINLAIAP